MCFKYSVALFGLIFGFCLRFEFNFGGLVVLLDAEQLVYWDNWFAVGSDFGPMFKKLFFFQDIYSLILWRQPGAILSSPPNPFGKFFVVIATTGKPPQLAFTCRAPFWFHLNNSCWTSWSLRSLLMRMGTEEKGTDPSMALRNLVYIILWGKRKKWQLNHVYQYLSMFAYFLECVLVSTAYSLICLFIAFFWYCNYPIEYIDIYIYVYMTCSIFEDHLMAHVCRR